MNILVKWQLVLALGYSCLIIIHEKNSWKQTSYTPWQITVIVILWNFPMAMWLYYKYSNSADVQNVVVVTNVIPVFKVLNYSLLLWRSVREEMRHAICMIEHMQLFSAPTLPWFGVGMVYMPRFCKMQKQWHFCEI